MKRAVRFFALFVAALPLVAFLPFYVRRSMTRSQTTGGDVIGWGWNFSTLYNFWADADYFRPEENFVVWLVLNVALAGFYALVIALVGDQFINFIKRRGAS